MPIAKENILYTQKTLQDSDFSHPTAKAKKAIVYPHFHPSTISPHTVCMICTSLQT